MEHDYKINIAHTLYMYVFYKGSPVPITVTQTNNNHSDEEKTLFSFDQNDASHGF